MVTLGLKAVCVTTLNFYYCSYLSRDGVPNSHSTLNPDTYRLVLDYIWTEGFQKKIVNTFKKLSDMFFVKDGEDIKIKDEIIAKYKDKDWELTLYSETSKGVMTAIPSEFSYRVIHFNPTSKEAIRRILANLVFYTLFVPRCMATIKITSQNYFLFYDPFGLHTIEYVKDIHFDKNSLRPEFFFWKGGNGDCTDVEYREFIESFRISRNRDECITPADLRYFLGFRPPRGNNMDIKLYLIDKFTDLLEDSFHKDYFPENIDLIENLF